MAERQLHGLQRVLGVSALSSTAYGNVGSSIYSPPGLAPALAAGLTPLVFLITGALFYCTATTYAEATAMYPEAGGSSLFARQAFNEFWSFFTAWAQMLNYVITIATAAYPGIETISNRAGEARDEAKTIPASIKRVMVAVFAIYFTLPWVALSALPVECRGGTCTTLLGVTQEEGGYASDPILGIVSHMGLGSLEGAARAYVAILAVTILVAATNAGVLGVSRLVFSMGMHRQMPDSLRRLHSHFRTPYIGILVFSALACVALLPGQADFLGLIYAFGAMLSFSMAHLAVIRLRVSAPDVARPYRSPGRLGWRGRDLPPFAMLGLAGTL